MKIDRNGLDVTLRHAREGIRVIYKLTDKVVGDRGRNRSVGTMDRSGKLTRLQGHFLLSAVTL